MPRLLRQASALALAAAALTACAEAQRTPPPEQQAVAAWPSADVPISDMDKAVIQASLNKLGYDAGAVDGFVGRRTRVAIRAFQADIGAPSTGYYSPLLVERLKQEAGPVSVATPEAVAPKPVAAKPAAKPAAAKPKPVAAKPRAAAPKPTPVAAKPAPAPAPEPAPKKKDPWAAVTDNEYGGGDGGDGGGGGW